MPPPDYKIVKVRDAARYHAQRLAVFSSLYGHTKWLKQRDPCGSIIDALDTTRKLWQHQVCELRDAMWPPAQTQIGFQHLLWCPPIGVTTTNMKIRCCNRPMVCPFCYARCYVMQQYMQIERVLYADTKPDTRPETANWHLVEYSVGVEMATNSAWGYDSIRKRIRERHPVLSSNKFRSREFRCSGADYGVVLYRVEPLEGTDSQGDSWGKLRIRRSGLLLTKHLVTRETFGLGEDDEFELHDLSQEKQVKKTLAAAAGRVFAYPAGMMFSSAEAVRAVMDEMAKCRMISTFGFIKKKGNT